MNVDSHENDRTHAMLVAKSILYPTENKKLLTKIADGYLQYWQQAPEIDWGRHYSCMRHPLQQLALLTLSPKAWLNNLPGFMQLMIINHAEAKGYSNPPPELITSWFNNLYEVEIKNQQLRRAI